MYFHLQIIYYKMLNNNMLDNIYDDNSRKSDRAENLRSSQKMTFYKYVVSIV